MRGVKFMWTPPISGSGMGISTWKIAKAAAVQRLAMVIVLLSIFFTFRSQTTQTAIRMIAMIHHEAAQKMVKAPSGR